MAQPVWWKNYWLKVILISMGVISCAAILGSCWIVLNVVSRSAPEDNRSFEIEDLLIDVSVFPPDWQASEAGPRPPASAPLGGYTSIERISLDFYTPGGGAGEAIHRFWNSRESSQEFDRQIPIWFGQGEYETPWEIPATLDYQSPYADRFQVACARHGTDPLVGQERCHMIGQYSEYFVRFGTHIGPSMTYEDFEAILQAIDARMESYLGE